MKGLVSLLIVFSVLLSSIVLTSNASTYDEAKNDVVSDSKIISPICMDQTFDENSIIVVLLKEFSGLKTLFSPSDFPEISISHIEDLSCLDMYSTNALKDNAQSFNQSMRIYLANPGRENVISAVNALSNNPIVKIAQPDYLISNGFDTIPNDPQQDSQYSISKIQASSAWNLTTGNSTVQVGVIDSGIAVHEDLNANVVSGYDFCNNNTITSDDNNGHGTHVAGIIGAVGNNGKGIAGINWSVSLVPLQVSYENYIVDPIDGSVHQETIIPTTAIVNAINYARVNNIPFLNMSITVPDDYPALENAISNYTGLLICAAGNKGREVNDDFITYPTSYDLDNIISVASTNSNDTMASTSNYSSEYVDIAAPGVDILSTYNNGNYATKSGTSMASPCVAGVAALLKSYNQNLTTEEIKYILLNSVDTISTLETKVVSGGRLNAYKALQMILPGNKLKNYRITYKVLSSKQINHISINQSFDNELIDYYGFENGPAILSGTTGYTNLINNSAVFDYQHAFIPRTIVAVLEFNSKFVNPTTAQLFGAATYNALDGNGNPVSCYKIATSALIGDVNGDNVTDSADSVAILQYCNGTITLTNTQKLAADVNNDGIIDSSDSTKILQYTNNTINSFF